MYGSLPAAARTLLWVRLLNQLGGFAIAFLAVIAGPDLVTAALTVFGLAALVSRWAGGVLLDRAPPRTLIVAGLLTTGAFLLLLAAARGTVATLTCVALTGLAFEIYEPPTTELLARVTSGAERRVAYAAFGTSLAAAGAVSGLLAAVLLPVGARWLLVADGATCLLAGAIAWSRLPAAPRPVRVPRTPWRPPAPLMRLTASATAFAFGYLAVIMFLPLVLLRRGAPEWLPGLTLAAAALLAPAGARASRFVPPAVGTSLLGALALLMAWTTDVTLTVAAYVGWAITGGALIGAWPAIAADHAPEDDRPRWFAFLGLSWGIAQPAVPGVVGLAGGTGRTSMLAAAVAFLCVPPLLSRHTARTR